MITAIDDRTALVLIDLQNGIVKNPTAHPVNEIVNNAAKLVTAFRKAQLPVVIVNVDPTGAAWTKARVQQPASPKNAAAQPPEKQDNPLDITPGIPTKEDDIFITKKTWNAFYNTALHQKLQELHITGIVLGGISTSIGVEGTARAASELGYNISFAEDAMTDRVAAAHENSLQYIFPRIGEIDSTDKIIEKLSGK